MQGTVSKGTACRSLTGTAKSTQEENPMTDQASYTLKVDGMSCKHCEAAVTEAAQSVAGVTAVNVDLEAGSVTVQGGEPEAVIQAITEAGYTASMA